MPEVPQFKPEEMSRPPAINPEDLCEPTARIFQRGGWGKADILLLDAHGNRAIVKDFGKKLLPVRWYGRWQIRREASIYRRLSGIPGVPKYFGRIGKNAMAIQYVEGERISHWRRRELPPALFSRLWDLIAAIHSRGIVHIDLRKRDNILIAPSGEVFIIDFNASFRFEPGSFGERWLLPTLKKIDHFGFLKWKAALAPAQLSNAERSAYRRMSFLRRFWIFK